MIAKLVRRKTADALFTKKRSFIFSRCPAGSHLTSPQGSAKNHPGFAQIIEIHAVAVILDGYPPRPRVMNVIKINQGNGGVGVVGVLDQLEHRVSRGRNQLISEKKRQP